MAAIWPKTGKTQVSSKIFRFSAKILRAPGILVNGGVCEAARSMRRGALNSSADKDILFQGFRTMLLTATIRLRRGLMLGVLSLSCALLAAPVHAAVHVDESEIIATALGGDGSFDETDPPFSGTTIPTASAPVNASALDGTFSHNLVDWSTSSGQTVLSLAMSHKRGASSNSSASADSWAYIKFTVNADATYELSGSYKVTDVGADESGSVWLYGELYDVDADEVLFLNYQSSLSTTNEQFNLGEEAGENDLLMGSLTGNLTSGHTYEWYSQATIDSLSLFLGPNLGASAVGDFSLRIVDEIDNGGVVPEATSVLIWGLLGLAVAARGWHRRERR